MRGEAADRLADGRAVLLYSETTVLLVEQNADLALGLSDRAYVINNGSIAWRGDARALQANPGLRQRLLGV